MKKLSNGKVVDFDVKQMVGHLIRVSQQVHYALWLEMMSEEMLTSPQFAVLHALAHDGPLGQRELGDRASLDRSNVADVIARLQRRQLLGRSPDPFDARRKLVALTRTGRQVHDRAVPIANDINEALLAPLDEDEREQLVELLTKILDHHLER